MFTPSGRDGNAVRAAFNMPIDERGKRRKIHVSFLIKRRDDRRN